jgi:DNA-binding MarR family transcriptional regulator
VKAPSSFPDDVLRRLLQHLVRIGGLLEPNPVAHEHAGVRVSMSEVFALGELEEAGALSQQELATRLGLEKSTVSRLAAGMQARGWLSRERDAANRRFYRLSLTVEGRDVARRVGRDVRDHHVHLLELLTSVEREALGVGLAGLIRALESHRHPPEQAAEQAADRAAEQAAEQAAERAAE